MEMKYFPSIDPEATGRHITELRKARGYSVRDLQDYFGFEAPQAIYKWQNGSTLPSVDNLLALSVLLEVPMEAILVTAKPAGSLRTDKEPAGSVFLCSFDLRRRLGISSPHDHGYHAMLLTGGKLYPPMAETVDGKLMTHTIPVR